MKVGFTYDLKSDYLSQGYSIEETAELDKEETIDAIAGVLTRHGFEVCKIGHIKNLVKKLAQGERWDIVFNICEGMHGIGREAQVPALLDAYNIPYTFSDPLILSLTLNKAMTKRAVRDLGILTPDFAEVSDVDQIKNIHLNYPLFVKPIAEGSSKGVDKFSKVNNLAELVETCGACITKFNQSALVEEFLPGREFTVALVGSKADPQVLGVMEIIVKNVDDADSYSYGNKENFVKHVTYEIARDAKAMLCEELALKVWHGLGCVDAARIDIRLDRQGNPAFIEINPLPGLNPLTSDIPILCGKVGYAYDKLIQKIVDAAIERAGFPLASAIPQKMARSVRLAKPLPTNGQGRAAGTRRRSARAKGASALCHS